ncbi:MAG TPA: N-acetylmuramoyl-L-alanine amidase, partial [Flavisolibacter sp.]|nr:N-acetylmuramoyl-L-alanine amidase [Flavisolibacter sp.]
MILFACYISKVFICSGILYIYYLLSLRNKNFHKWNRFYLLSVVFVSLLLPLIRINITSHDVVQPAGPIHLLQIVQSANQYMDEVSVTADKSLNLDNLFVYTYIFVSFILLFFFIHSVYKLYSIVRAHNAEHINNIKFINTSLKDAPFSFFRYIFWNPEIELNSETGQQIFKHELAHVEEGHSFDKVFLQVILVFFWINPIFWIIRKELKLIHEFLADKKSVGASGTEAFAAMILQSAYPQQFHSFANHFFQTSIKRRLFMLTKTQRQKFINLSRLLLLPIIALITLAFSIQSKTTGRLPVSLEKNITVIIDAGHGGIDKGVVSGNVSEAEVALSISRKIKELNVNKSIRILLSRQSAEIVNLRDRVNFAKNNNADLFISIHLNADQPDLQNQNPAKSKSGIEVLVPKNNPSVTAGSE